MLSDKARAQQKQKNAARPRLDESRFCVFREIGGEEEIRTLDPHVANVVRKLENPIQLAALSLSNNAMPPEMPPDFPLHLEGKVCYTVPCCQWV